MILFQLSIVIADALLEMVVNSLFAIVGLGGNRILKGSMSGSLYPEAFEGDGFIEVELRRLVAFWEIRTIFETGTYQGKTTLALAEMPPAEYIGTIEIQPEYVELAEHLQSNRKVRRFIGDSADVLNTMLAEFIEPGPMLFYLDAHWGAHSPLLEELEAIAAAGLGEPPVIAIHDFFNPLHPEYGFDTWDIGQYRLELVEPALEGIYGPGGWRHWYNDQAAGLKRGIIYIEPKGEK
jgi:hypothetical protein